MRLFLIRHGETVDNVAQVYAGSRDSALTNHGCQQATRLGLYFKDRCLSFSHIFSSHLERAYQTAGLIRDAQVSRPPLEGQTTATVPDVVKLPVLMEQDFGFYEGKKWYERPTNPEVSLNKILPGFVDIESKASMARRMDTFLDTHLLPLFDSPTAQHYVVAIVSHGIVLSVLWKRLLARLPPNSIMVLPNLLRGFSGSLDRLGSWSNTGYLELHMQALVPSPLDLPEHSELSSAASKTSPSNTEARSSNLVETNFATIDKTATDRALTNSNTLGPAPSSSQLLSLKGWNTTVCAINGKEHLKGLKRTGGGVGSARHDITQKSIDTFFKRRRTD
ncbi:phosphoglycerate mutase-like protein [Delitschia confertaspora ATCC 74209]|uniref:Phosphoglycerate mutase-like protein n=1 Tax=Delitschia confertaspora ATCC 74209 TaxID=1513339 RepID=A0A9P4JT07_9PLEO|nr:phosphoglycerate mutase-like protein [Delitschia confertaspora ATCC 74209]